MCTVQIYLYNRILKDFMYQHWPDFSWRKVRAAERRWKPIGSQLGKGPIKSSCYQLGVTPFQATYYSARDSSEKLDEIGPAE